MKKKLLICLAMVVCILTLTACGKEMTQNSFITKDEAQENAEGICEELGAMQQDAAARGMTLTAYAEEYEKGYAQYSNSEQFAQILQMVGMTEEEMQKYVAIHAAGAKSLDSASAECGSFVSVLSDKTEVKITEDKAEVAVKIQGDKAYKENKHRTATVEIVMTEEGYESITISTDYEMSELMTKAALNTLLGMGTVFAVLILIFGLISCFVFIPPIQAKCEKIGKKIRKFFRKFRKKHKDAEEAESESAPAPVKASPQAVVAEETDDTELIAVIAAAIAASEGAASADGYVVRSIIRR